MKIRINEAMCLGCKRCTKICPEVFKMSGDKAVALVPESSLEAVQIAFEDCPAPAIILE